MTEDLNANLILFWEQAFNKETFLLWIVGFLYLTPAIIAWTRNKKLAKRLIPVYITIFAGWTIFGWIFALYLAVKKQK